MSGYRDQIKRFTDGHAQVLGVSTDDLATLKKFADSLKLPFPLLSDEKGKTAAAYDVKILGFARRVTFVIDPQGKVEKVLEGKDALDPSPAAAACPTSHHSL